MTSQLSRKGQIETVKQIRRMCSLCHTPQPVYGGKLRHVLGLRSWVCADCKPKEKP
jgi:hypothetical protein